MKWINIKFEKLSYKLYPSKWWLLISAVVGIAAANLLHYQDVERIAGMVAVLAAWPFFLWFVVFIWGHPEKPGYIKTPFFIQLICGPAAFIGLFVLVPLTIWGTISVFQ